MYKRSTQIIALFLAFVFLGLIFTVHSALSLTQTEAKQALLISVDGFRPDFYLSEKFQMPTVRDLLQNGAYATGSVPAFPSVTYPNHTTLITGEPPGIHGVLSNTLFSLEKGPEPGWLWEISHIKIPTLLDLVQSKGMTTASIRWPVSLFGRATYLVPEIFGMTGYYEGKSWDLTVKYTDPQLMTEILQHTTLQSYSNDEEMDHWVSEATKYLLEKHKPTLTAVHLANVDHIEHGEGRDSEETVRAVADADQNIKTILSAVNLQNTCVLIVGDHGFFNVAQKISPNVLFADRGWIQLDENKKIKSWTVIAHASGGQAAIYTKDKKLTKDIKALLLANEHHGYHLIQKKELKKLGAYPDAAFAISALDGFTVSGGVEGAVVTPSSVKGQHGHLPTDPQMHTGFVASGCGIEPGQNLGVISNLDVAPTVAKLLGVKMKARGKPLKIKRD